MTSKTASPAKVNLAGFSNEAADIVRKYEAAGWVFRLSSKGHAIGRSPVTDQTCSVSRRAGGRVLKNALAQMERDLGHDNIKKRLKALSEEGWAEILAGVPLSELSDPNDQIIARGIDRKVVEEMASELNATIEQVKEEYEKDAEIALEILNAPFEKRPHSQTAIAVGKTVRGTFRIVHYECRRCGEQFDKARSVGQHWRTCNGNGNVALPTTSPDGQPRVRPEAGTRGPDKPKELVRAAEPSAEVESGDVADGVVEPAGHAPAAEPEPVSESTPPASVVLVEPADDPSIIAKIRELVAPELQIEVELLREENARLRAAISRFTSDFGALREIVDTVDLSDLR